MRIFLFPYLLTDGRSLTPLSFLFHTCTIFIYEEVIFEVNRQETAHFIFEGGFLLLEYVK